jgi:hypothetical protein
MILKGRVNIVAKPGMRLEIPDGVVLQDKVNQRCYQADLEWLFLFFKKGTFGCRVGWLSFLSLLYRMRLCCVILSRTSVTLRTFEEFRVCFDKLQGIC